MDLRLLIDKDRREIREIIGSGSIGSTSEYHLVRQYIESMDPTLSDPESIQGIQRLLDEFEIRMIGKPKAE